MMEFVSFQITDLETNLLKGLMMGNMLCMFEAVGLALENICKFRLIL